jgi:glycosyltransferase involved in cell wall biosynthesis
MQISRRTGIPWVADFRDEWAANSPVEGQPRVLTQLAVKAERAITATADRIIVAADYFRLQGLVTDAPRRTVIMNGVDDADLPNDFVRPSKNRFVLAHVGTVYESFDPSPALRVLSDLVERGEIDREHVEVRFVGSIWSENFLPPPGVRFERIGYVEHAHAINEMASATALLLYRPRSSLAPSGKLFEYLASGRPLLCITHPDNLAARLVREWNAGVVADPDDEAEIEAAILTLWRAWKAGGLQDQAEVRSRTLELYSRQAGAARLAQVLDEAVHG